MSLALAGFGSYAYYMSQTQNLDYVDSAVVGQHDWIPLLCVLVFTTALALGISPISWLLIGELFPLEYRGLGSSISTSFSYFCAFFGIKLFMDFQQVSNYFLLTDYVQDGLESRLLKFEDRSLKIEKSVKVKCTPTIRLCNIILYRSLFI